MNQFLVLVKRANGRLVRSYERPSRYSAKLFAKILESRYDETYSIVVERKN